MMVIFTLLLSFVLCCTSIFAQSNQKTDNDSIPLHLVPLKTPFTLSSPYETLGKIIYQPWPEQPDSQFYEFPFILTGITPGCTIAWSAPCGEFHYPNGRLSTRIECENGIQHGRTIYWDEQGHKTTEYYYIKGKMISSKIWNTKGQMISWINYNGKGELHGKYLSLDEDNNHKITTSYVNGIEHGLHKEYWNGKISVCEKFKMGDVVERTTYFANGKVYEHALFYQGTETEFQAYFEFGGLASSYKNDTLGRRTDEITRNERGIITMERHFKDNKAIGTTLDYYDDLTDKKIATEYIDGLPLVSLVTVRNHVIQKTQFTNGQIQFRVDFYENGDSSVLYVPGAVNYKKIWNSSGKVTDEYFYLWAGLLVNKGYYSLKDTTYLYYAQREPSLTLPVKVLVIYNNDTLRIDYIMNNINFSINIGNTILASNYYIKDPESGKCLEQGIWKYYDGNTISHVLTFEKGRRQGRAVYYSQTEPPVVASSGFFENDKKHGEWLSYSENGDQITTYFNGEETGSFTYFYPTDKIKIQGTRIKGLIEGPYKEFHENGMLKWDGIYSNGKKNGYCRTFDNTGRIVNEGYSIDDSPAGKWYFYTYDKNGKVHRTKTKYTKSSELKRMRRQNEIGEDSDTTPISLRSQNQFFCS